MNRTHRASLLAVPLALSLLLPPAAQALDLDLGTVKSRIARAREKLRKYFTSSGNFSEYLPSKVAERGAEHERMRRI